MCPAAPAVRRTADLRDHPEQALRRGELQAAIRCWPSPRCSSIEKLVNPPAWSVVEPAVKRRANGSGEDGQASAIGPPVIAKRCGEEVRDGRAAPRREVRARRIGPAHGVGVLQRRLRATAEGQLEVGERQLRGVAERRRELARLFVQMHVPDELQVHPVARGRHQQLQIRRVRLQHVDVAFEPVRAAAAFRCCPCPTLDAAGHDGGLSGSSSASSEGWHAARPAAWPGIDRPCLPAASRSCSGCRAASLRWLGRPSCGHPHFRGQARRRVGVGGVRPNRRRRIKPEASVFTTSHARRFRASRDRRRVRSSNGGRRDAEPQRASSQASGNVRNECVAPARYTPHHETSYNAMDRCAYVIHVRDQPIPIAAGPPTVKSTMPWMPRMLKANSAGDPGGGTMLYTGNLNVRLLAKSDRLHLHRPRCRRDIRVRGRASNSSRGH